MGDSSLTLGRMEKVGFAAIVLSVFKTLYVLQPSLNSLSEMPSAILGSIRLLEEWVW